MCKYKVITVLFLALILVSCRSRKAKVLTVENDSAAVTVYKNFTLIDGNGGVPIENAYIRVENGRITKVSTRYPVSAGYAENGKEHTIDLQGKTVLPGIINSHVHNAYNENNVRNWLNGGVTTVREMSAWGGDPLEHRDRLNQNPKNAFIVSATPIMAPESGGYGEFHYSTPEDAAQNVKQFAEQGFDIIKFSIEDDCPGGTPWKLTTYKHAESIVNAARECGLKTSAHITHTRHMKWAIDVGVDDIAHSAWDGVYSDEDINHMIEKNIYLIPTLELYSNFGDYPLNYGKENVRKFFAAGGKIALGTDFDGAGPDGVFDKGLPIKEIRYMSECGMPNMDIIVAATKNAAYVCDLADEIGTLEAGKKADFIVVDGDPLSDINALLNLEMIVHGGVEIK